MGGDRCSAGLPLYSHTSNCGHLLEEAVSHGPSHTSSIPEHLSAGALR